MRQPARRAGAATIVAIVLLGATAPAQEPIDAAMIRAIRTEGLERSQVPDLFRTLTDILGPRLSGSPAYDAAALWARDRFAAWGLKSARLEPFDLGARSWTLEKMTLEMTAPRYMPLIGYAEAWSPSTRGPIVGAPVYIGDSTGADIDALGGRLRGAIVLMARPQTQFLAQDRPQPGLTESPVQTGNPPFPSPTSQTPRREALQRLRNAGAAVALVPGPTEHGTVRVEGSLATAPDSVPVVVVAAEQYNMLVRLAEAGERVELRVEVGVRAGQTATESHNVLAEIPGADPRVADEVVLLGAHLDSWHTAAGATDNADGVATVMEAMRMLAALDARPRRTIRVALWGGEEQGLIGSRAWVAQHLGDGPDRENVALYLNDDPGTGPTYGFYMEGNAAAKAIFDAWLAPLSDLGVRRNIIEGIGSTDHVPFVRAGVAAFNTIKEFEHYDVRTRHTNADLPDAVNVDDLKQSAVVLAVFAWHAAMREAPIPSGRRP